MGSKKSLDLVHLACRTPKIPEATKKYRKILESMTKYQKEPDFAENEQKVHAQGVTSEGAVAWV